MNNKEAIRRKKLYFEGLERAIAQPVPEATAIEIDEIINDPDCEENCRLSLQLWKEVSAPLSVAIAFIHDNRVLPQYKEEVVFDETETPFVQLDEIYDTLRTLVLPTVGEFLSMLQISTAERKGLLDFIENGDKDGFVSLLEKTQCDTMPLARLCSHCMDDVMAGLNMAESEKPFYLDYLNGILDSGNAVDEKIRDALEQLQPYYEQNIEELQPESEEHYFLSLFNYIKQQLTADLHYYWDYYDLYTLKERNLIESILDNPLAVNLVNQIWEEYKAGFESAPFSLPDDFFDWKHKSDTPREYFYMDDTLKKKGAETLVAFINWLADKGYIADDNDVKALFAYRLTGRCRPEGKELPAIEWRGKNGKSYELIYLVRFLSERGDYKKMRRFFTGPEWVKDRDSSYANAADSEFRKQMSEFYPEACKFVV